MKPSSVCAPSSNSNGRPMHRFQRSLAIRVSALFAILLAATFGALAGAEPQGLLERFHKHVMLTSTITDNGDLNPYAVIIAPVTAGSIQKDDVLIDNFNNLSNLQGTGTTIVDYTPSTKKVKLFAKIPPHLAQCPGGVGLSTAMTMLKTGWVIVGSTPSTDGTTRTKGDGCLIVLDPSGNVAEVWAGPNINDPWGNMATLDNGSTATLFISMSGFDLPAPGVHDPATGNNLIVRKAKVMRMTLTIPAGKPPVLSDETVVGDGFAEQADLDNFLFGPTGVALGPDGTIYVSDGLGNAIVAIPDAVTRTTSAGTGRVVTKDGLLKNPLALVMAPNGHLLAANGLNGQIVEIDPVAGKQLYAQWLDVDQAQSPPGNGDLFGLAVKPDGSGIYYVEDDTNVLVEDRP